MRLSPRSILVATLALFLCSAFLLAGAATNGNASATVVAPVEPGGARCVAWALPGLRLSTTDRDLRDHPLGDVRYAVASGDEAD